MENPDPPDRPSRALGGGNVLCLKTFRAFLDFKFHCLSFIQRLVTVHLNSGEVHENIFPSLALDKTEPLRRIEPLHSSLFFQVQNLNICLALLLLVRDS